MTDESKLLIAQDRGAKAKLVMENELIVEAFKAIKYTYIKAWQDTAPVQTDARENLYQALQIVGDVQRHFEGLIANGKLAAKELDLLAQRQRPPRAA